MRLLMLMALQCWSCWCCLPVAIIIRYLWVRGINRIELYNEPDLDNDFDLGTSFNNPLWVDTYMLRSRAIQDLFADMNTENSGLDYLPNVHVGAFAKTQYNEGKMGQPAVQAIHRTFASGVSPNPAWFNMHTYSYHSYGESLPTTTSSSRPSSQALPSEG